MISKSDLIKRSQRLQPLFSWARKEKERGIHSEVGAKNEGEETIIEILQSVQRLC